VVLPFVRKGYPSAFGVSFAHPRFLFCDDQACTRSGVPKRLGAQSRVRSVHQRQAFQYFNRACLSSRGLHCSRTGISNGSSSGPEHEASRAAPRGFPDDTRIREIVRRNAARAIRGRRLLACKSRWTPTPTWDGVTAAEIGSPWARHRCFGPAGPTYGPRGALGRLVCLRWSLFVLESGACVARLTSCLLFTLLSGRGDTFRVVDLGLSAAVWRVRHEPTSLSVRFDPSLSRFP